jgi:membrane protein
MREKVCNLIYLNPGNYISLESLKILYWGIIIIPFFMVLIGIVAINMIGVSWRSLFPIVSIVIWSILYWTFVLTIQSKKTKKTFKLRFLVNGIFGVFISSLFWIFAASFNLASETQFLQLDFFLWLLFFYLLFSFIYVFVIILCVQKGVFALIKKKSKTKTALKISAFFGSLIPVSGVLGIYASRLMRAHTSISTQHSVITISTCLLVFLPALAHINFVQYYYCKKYGITCDEDGNETSPELERKPKARKRRARKMKKVKKKLPLAVRILIGIVCTFAAIFLILFIIGAIIISI